MVKKSTVTKKVNDFNVTMLDNGFTLTYSGENDESDWADTKLVVTDIDKLCELIRGVVELPRD